MSYDMGQIKDHDRPTLIHALWFWNACCNQFQMAKIWSYSPPLSFSVLLHSEKHHIMEVLQFNIYFQYMLFVVVIIWTVSVNLYELINL